MRVVNAVTLFWRSHEIYSNWYPSDFAVDGVRFNCGEQWMMYSKARLFGDAEVAAQILAEPHARRQKELGRKVRGFDQARWDAQCEALVFEGLYAKFAQNPALREAILATGDTVIAEASPTDRIWGIGMEENDEGVEDPRNWRGENRLGKVLMQVRQALRERA